MQLLILEFDILKDRSTVNSLLKNDSQEPKIALPETESNIANLERMDSPFRRTLSRFVQNRLAVIGFLFLLFTTGVAILAPAMTPYDPYAVDLRLIRQAPSVEHWLGGDLSGRDVLTRVIFGARVSLTVGFLSVTLYVVIGTILGLISGFYRGMLDTIIMRLTDTMMSLPSLLLILMLVTLIEPGVSTLVIAITVTRWPQITRLVRAQVLSIREQEFILAVQALGAPSWRIILFHILPNVLSPVIVSASFGVASAILAESALSFLGFGIPPPTPSWGEMLNQAKSITVLRDMPWFWIPPGTMIALSVLSINFIGDGLRDAIDPHMNLDT